MKTQSKQGIVFCHKGRVDVNEGYVDTTVFTPELCRDEALQEHNSKNKRLTSNIFTSASSEPKSHRTNPTQKSSRTVLKVALPPVTKSVPVSPPASAPKIALMPPIKPALKSPPLPLPKPAQKPGLPPPPPLPPPKPQGLTAGQQQHTNGTHGPASPLRAPGNGDDAAENGEAGSGSNLEVGSMVEVNDPPLFGVIRWIGWINGISEPVAGIELVRTVCASVFMTLMRLYTHTEFSTSVFYFPDGLKAVATYN